uniref:G-protein coupled receptors family 1 profile domain-containing protein n=1 Tax=Globodera rostochiensis TaxID=31243 RepID=A0A914GR19_GLORO
MNVASLSADPSFYEVYKNSGFYPELVLFGTLRFMLAIACIGFNVALLFVTIRSKRLRGRCNILIGFDAVCSIATFSTNIPPFFIVASGTNFIPISNCFWIQILPAIGINLLLGAMLSVGIDRLLSVAAPVWSAMANPKIYLFVLICSCFAYASYAVWLLFLTNVLQTSDRDLYVGSVGRQLFYNAMIFTGLTLFCYLAIWALIRIRKFTNNEIKPEADYTRRLFNSLASIVLLVSVGYFLNAIFLILLPTFGLNNVQSVFASYLLHLATDLTGALNAPLLYLLSTEYRKAFDELFGRAVFVWRGNGSQSAVGPPHSMNIVRVALNNN